MENHELITFFRKMGSVLRREGFIHGDIEIDFDERTLTSLVDDTPELKATIFDSKEST